MHQAAQKQHEPPSDDGSAPRPRDDNSTTAPRGEPQQQQQPTTAPTPPQEPSSGRPFSRRLARTFHGALADDPNGAVFVVPKAALVHIPLGMSTPLTFCNAYAADPEGRGGGGCPAGADCPHAHADLSAAQRHVPHVRGAEWAAPGDVPYAMYGADDARAVRVKVTNSAAGAEVVSVRECLRTAVLEPGSELAQAAAEEAEEGDTAAAACVTRAGARITTLYHCAHWLVKRKCNYGPDCRFVHVALPSAQTLQRPMNPSGAPQKNAERQEDDDADPLSPAASSPRSRGDDDRRGLAAAAIEDEQSSQRDDDDDDLDSMNSSHSTDGLFTLPATAVVTKPSDGRDDHEASPPTADLLTTQPPSMVCVPELRAEDNLVDVGLPLQVSRRQYSQHHQPSHHDQHPQQQQQHPSTVPGAAVGEQSASDRHDDAVDAAGLSGKFARFSSLPLQQQHAAHHGSPQLRASLHRHSDASMRTADASYLTDPRRASFAASYAHNSSNSAMLHMSSMAQSSAAWDPRRGSASLSISHATLVDPSSATTAHRAATAAAAAGGDVASHPGPAGDGQLGQQQRSTRPPAHQQQRRYGDGDLALAAASLESMPGSVLGSSSQRVQLGSSAEHPLLRGDVAVTPPATHHHLHCYQQQHVDAAALRADEHVMPPRPQRSSAPRRFPFRHQPYAARPLPSLTE